MGRTGNGERGMGNGCGIDVGVDLVPTLDRLQYSSIEGTDIENGGLGGFQRSRRRAYSTKV